MLKEGNDLVMNHLEEEIVYANKITHSYPLDWRTKEPVILRASEQWFINTSLLKEKAAQEVNISDIKISFNFSKITYLKQQTVNLNIQFGELGQFFY